MMEENSEKVPDQSQPAAQGEQLEDIVAVGDPDQVNRFLQTLDAGESARMLAELSDDEQSVLLKMLPNADAAALIEQIPEAQAAQMISNLSVGEAAGIVEEMHSDEQADVLGRLKPREAEAILTAMDPAEAVAARRLVDYPTDTAGGLMITEYLCFRRGLLVDDVLNDLRANAEKYATYDVQYAYVMSEEGRLVGVLRLRELLLSSRQTPIASVMICEPLWVYATTPLTDLGHFFDRHPLFGAPVTDEVGRMLGVVRRADVEEAAEERANRTFLKFMGILGGEELRSLPLATRCGRRLSWLSINILLNILAAGVIALNQDTLAQVIVLAVFLPIISDMSGCSGNQAVAVSMRELALGLARPRDLCRVLRKEAALGLLNGVALGILLGVVGLIWQGSPVLGLVVGGALAINTLFACCFGGTIPLLLRGLKLDPALASGPVLTTLTDMCGFFLVLTFAKWMLPYLVAA